MKSALAAALLLLAGCAAPARLSGRVVADGESLPGARVELTTLDGRVRAEAVSEADGGYAFSPVRPGAYRLRAAKEGSPPLVAVAGRTPLRLAPGADAWVGLQAVPRETPVRRPAAEPIEGFGSLRGRALDRGRPLEGAVAALYVDEAEGLKGPGFRQAFPTGPDGIFAFDEVPEGSYFLAVRRRELGGGTGPVREGDLYGVATENPIPVASGEETSVDVHLVRKEKDEDPNDDLLALTGTGLRGRVVDAGGRPVEGVSVFAYRNRTIGHGMPDHLSLPTGPDGAFALSLGEGGLFYVGARERSGGSPAPGEWFGLYEGSADHGLVVKKGRVLGPLDLVVRKVLPP